MSVGYIIDHNTASDGYNRVGGASITATSVNTTSLAKLYNRRQSRACQGSALTGIIIDFDMGSAIDVDCVAVLGHNFTTSVTCNIKADDDPAFGSPGVNLNLTYNADQIIYLWSSTQSYRYWRLSIDDATNTAYPWIGELILGKLTTFTHEPTWGMSRVDFHEMVTHETDYGNVLLKHLRFSGKQRMEY